MSTIKEKEIIKFFGIPFDGYGTLADWIGIIVTALTIYLTVRYYANDNRRDFKIVLYPIFWTEKKNGVKSFSRDPLFYEFYAVNFSKNTDAIYFFMIRSKANWLARKFFRIPNTSFPLEFSEMLGRPDYETIEPKHSTKIKKIPADFFWSHAESLYKDARNKRFLRKIKLEIVYLNVEGKEFRKSFIFDTKSIAEYSKDKKTKKSMTKNGAKLR